MERFLHYTIEKEKAQFLSALKDRVSLHHKTQKNLREKRFILLLLRHRVVSCYDVEHGKGRYLASSNRRRVRKTIESIEQETRKGKSQWRPTDYEEGTPTLKTLYRQFENQHIIITGIKSPDQIGETLSAMKSRRLVLTERYSGTSSRWIYYNHNHDKISKEISKAKLRQVSG